MTSYYRDVNSTINPGFIASSEKVNDIQDHIDLGFSNSVGDLEGRAFVLSSTEDAFELSEVIGELTDGMYPDIENEKTTTVMWQSLENLYVRRKLDITKNEVKRITLKLRNSTSEPVTVTCSLYPDEFEYDHSIPAIKTISVEVAAEDADSYNFDFGANHLARKYHYLLVNRTDIEGVDIRVAKLVDTPIETSPERSEWQTLSHDIYIKEYYASEMTFNIVDATAVINGRKIRNLDTHIEIPHGSSYADRIDVVYLSDDNWLRVEKGTPARKPVVSSELEATELILARIRVPRNCVSTSTMTVDQDDEMGYNRRRCIKERVRRLERKQHWDWRYNLPRRLTVEFDEESEIIDTEASEDIGWVDDHLEITSRTTDDLLFDFNSETEVDTDTTTALMDYTNQTATLPILDEPSADLEILAEGAMVAEARGSYFRSTTKESRFLYDVFISPKDIKVSYLELALGYLENCTDIKLRIADYSTNTLVIESNLLLVSEYANVTRGNSLWRRFTFPNTFTFQKNKKYRIIIEATPEHGKTSTIYAPCYKKTHGDSTKCHVEYRYLTYPHWIGAHWADVANYYIPLRINATEKTYVSSAKIQSEELIRTYNINKARIDVNLTLDEDTSYSIDASVDGGETWKRVTNGSFYTFTTPDKHFKYRINLATSNEFNTPTVYYDSDDGYAVKISFEYTEGSPQSTGTFYSKPIDANFLILQSIGYGYEDSAFSHFQWLLTKIDPNEGELDLSMQYVDHPMWQNDTTYHVGDIVMYTDPSTEELGQYICTTATNTVPTNDTYWDVDEIDWEYWKMTGEVPADLWAYFYTVDPEYHDYNEEVDPLWHNYYCEYPARALYFPYIRYEINLTKKNEDPDEESPKVYMLGAILELR